MAPLSEAFIRALHEALTAAQETYVVYTTQGRQERPLPRGVYKSEPNHPWSAGGLRHAYAPVADTPPEMHRFVEQIRGSAFQSAQPVVQAAYSHYALACIHPFADGNGRVARAIASIYLYRAASVPMLVFADQKNLYLDALEAADAGDPQQFTDFVFERSVGAITRFTDILRGSSAPEVQSR
jgi:Fic family protein